MLKVCLVAIAIICFIGIALCLGLLVCIIAIDESTPPAWPNYWKGQEAKKERERK